MTASASLRTLAVQLVVPLLLLFLGLSFLPPSATTDKVESIRGGNPNRERGPATGVHCYDPCNDEGQPCSGCENQAEQEEYLTGSESLRDDLSFTCGKVKSGICVSTGSCNFTQTHQTNCSDITVIGPQ